jgi:hypothetical protein
VARDVFGGFQCTPAGFSDGRPSQRRISDMAIYLARLLLVLFLCICGARWYPGPNEGFHGRCSAGSAMMIRQGDEVSDDSRSRCSTVGSTIVLNGANTRKRFLSAAHSPSNSWRPRHPRREPDTSQFWGHDTGQWFPDGIAVGPEPGTAGRAYLPGVGHSIVPRRACHESLLGFRRRRTERRKP